MKTALQHPLIVKILLAVASILFSLVAIEVILRIFFPIYPVSMLRAYEYDSELGTRLRPGIHLFKTTDFQEEIQTNQLGTANFQENFSDYKAVVFAIGDSYTQGTGLPADMSYPEQLDLILNQDDNGFYTKKYGVVNLGLAAFGGEQELLALRRWATLIRRPQAILYMGSDNDYEDDLLFRSGYRHRHIVSGSPVWGWMTTPMQWLTNDLQIGLRLKIIAAQRRSSQISGSAAIGATKAERQPPAELERPVLERLLEYSKEYQALPVVSWSTEGDSYNWLKSWAEAHNVAFGDWAPKVDSVKASIPGMPEENQHSGGHHRGWVNRVIAEEYARQLRARIQ